MGFSLAMPTEAVVVAVVVGQLRTPLPHEKAPRLSALVPGKMVNIMSEVAMFVSKRSSLAMPTTHLNNTLASISRNMMISL